MPSAMTPSQYAKHRGVSPSYVTQLAREGRLVRDDAGNILADETDALIAATGDPSKAGVAKRHADNRAAKVFNDDFIPKNDTEKAGAAYQQSRAVKERFLALEAKRAYEQAIGRLADVGEVEAVVSTAMTEIRLQLENLAVTLAPTMVAMTSEVACTNALRDEFDRLLAGVAAHFEKLSKGKQA